MAPCWGQWNEAEPLECGAPLRSKAHWQCIISCLPLPSLLQCYSSMLCIEGSCHIALTSILDPSGTRFRPPNLTSFSFVFLHTFGHPNGTPNGSKMVRSCVPFWSCFSNHDFVIFWTIFGDNDDHRFAQSVCFSMGFPMIFAIAHVGITFVFAMLLVLQLDPFWLPDEPQNELQIASRERFRMRAFWGPILGPFWMPFGTLLATQNCSRSCL